MSKNYTIPDHSPAALAEAYETALFSLAFQQMEEEELQMMQKKIVTHAKSTDHQVRFARRLSRKLRRERNRVLIMHALPRIAQVAACLIAIVSIGAGVALAASPAARSWAAGVLVGTETGEKSIFGDEPLRSSIDDGIAVDGQLILLEDESALLVRDSTDAEPVRYQWDGQGSRSLTNLVVENGTIYALYEIRTPEGDAARAAFVPPEGEFYVDTTPRFERLGLGRVRLRADGSFAVEELADFDAAELFDRQGRPVSSHGVSGIAAGNGKLYFTTHCEVPTKGMFIGDLTERLFACNLTDYELTELDFPIGDSEEYRLFGSGEVFVALISSEMNPAHIHRIEADGSFTLMAEFAEKGRPNSFAYSAETDTLYYQLDSSVYAAPHFDIANARRVALSGGIGGRGLLIGDNSYVIVQFNGAAEVFDFDAGTGDVIELVTNLGTFMEDSLRAACPNLELAADPAEREDGDYAEKILTGESKADLIYLEEDEYMPLRDAGYGKAIADAAVCAAIDSMPEGLRKFVARGDEYIALPWNIYTAADVEINETHWREMGFGKLPETWLELLNFMAELSHSANPSDYYISISQYDGTPLQQITERMVQGFARSWAARGMAPDFGGEDFAQALAALQEIDFNALHFENGMGGDSGSYEQFLLNFGYAAHNFRYHTDYSPDESSRSLTIRPGDPIYSDTYTHLLLISPETEQEDAALAYMRWRISDVENGKRWRYDFSTPAEELADRPESVESIQNYRAQVGDMFVPPWGYEERQEMYAAFTAYAGDEIDFAALAARLNEIYAA